MNDCYICGGQTQELGALGFKRYTRCRDCGTVQSQSAGRPELTSDPESRRELEERIGYSDPRDEGAEYFEPEG